AARSRIRITSPSCAAPPISSSARRPFVNITRSNIDAEGGGVSLTATRANRTAGRRFLTVTALPLAGASSASTHCPVRRSTRRHRYAASASNPSRRAYSAIETPDLCHPLQRASHIALIVPCCSRVNMPSSFSSVQPTCHQESAIYGRASLPNRLRLKCTYPDDENYQVSHETIYRTLFI